MLGKAYRFLALIRLKKKKELKNDRFITCTRWQGSDHEDDV